MTSPSILLPPLLLCISLLLPIVWSQQQSPSNGGNQATATVNHTAPRRSVPLFAREFLVAHNKVRMNVTHPLFTWDRALARYARRWGMKRAADCKMIHSYGPYGENLFWGALDHWTPTEAVESWVKEKEYYDAQNNACSNGQMCGHYTQIIWRDSVKLGCSRVKCQTGGILIICEYDPPGNYVNESPFVINIEAGAGAGNSANGTAGGGTNVNDGAGGGNTANGGAGGGNTANGGAGTGTTANGGAGGGTATAKTNLTGNVPSSNNQNGLSNRKLTE